MAETVAAPQFESRFEEWCYENLVIQHRGDGKIGTGTFVRFQFNPIQKRLWRLINEQYQKKGRVRIIVLKARKEGVSTLIEGMGYHSVVTKRGVHALVMAHETTSSQAIFDITHLFHTGNRGKPKEKNLTQKEIKFGSPHLSWFKVNTAGTKHYGSGSTIHFLHISELAKWKPSVVNDLLVSVQNAVPDAADTAVIIESTAKGASGAFYDKWQAAKRGNSEYIPVFFSWLEDPEYRDRGAKLTDPQYSNVPVEWTEKEEFLRQCGADEEQLCWRRRAIGEKCNGIPEIFSEEYPATDEEAFLSSGSPVFPISICKASLEAAKAQRAVRPPQYFSVNFEASWSEESAIEANPRGELSVWERPKHGKAYYLIPADVARGIQVNPDAKTERPRLDYSAAYVIDRVPRQKPGERARHHVIAAWHGRVDPDRFGAVLNHLGRWYGAALVCPEANNYGVTTIQRLLQLRYPNLFLKERFDKPTAFPIEQAPMANAMEYGWRTGTTGPKWVMITELNRMIRDREFECPDPDFWEETLVFERQPDGSLEARSGCHDDRIMAMAIGVAILSRHPPSIAEPLKIIKPDTEEWFEAVRAMREPKKDATWSMT